MTSRKNTQDERIRTPTTTVPQPRAFPETRRDRDLPPILESEPKVESPPSTADRWSTALAILGVCVLAAAIVGYIFYPAMSTLLDASVTTWSGEGP